MKKKLQTCFYDSIKNDIKHLDFMNNMNKVGAPLFNLLQLEGGEFLLKLYVQDAT